MADLVYDEVRKIVEALEVNPNLEQFFTRTREGKIEIKLSPRDCKYSYDSLKVGDRFFYKKWKGLSFTWREGKVTFKRSGVLFYRDSKGVAEEHVEKGSMFFSDFICPIAIIAGDRNKVTVSCSCELTEIRYD